MMTRTRWVHFGAALCLLLSLAFASIGGSAAQSEATPIATSAATSSVPDCTAQPSGTATLAATLSGTPAATTLATAITTEDASAPLRFVSLEPTDFHFTPNADKPVIVLIVFSLIFQNERADSFTVQNPHFQLAIDGAPWGELSSTDFATGQLLAHATQGIVLQDVLVAAKATDAQKAIMLCIKNNYPVDLTLTGTIEVLPGGTLQTQSVTLLAPQVVIRSRQTG